MIECNLRAEDKEITLRAEHGIDESKNFSKRLIRCPYVIKVVNSLSFHSRERRFIRRTLRETERIGEIIEERYGGI